jgi:hypothetical protein
MMHLKQHRSLRAQVRAKPRTEVEKAAAAVLDRRVSAALDAARTERDRGVGFVL